MSDSLVNFNFSPNQSKIKRKFPEITSSEEIAWSGSPQLFSMLSFYILALLIFTIHYIFFFYGSKIFGGDLVTSLIFFLTMIILARINHFLNFLTSNKYVSFWLLFSGLSPMFTITSEIVKWSEMYFLYFGLFFSIVLCVFSWHYQHSFTYVLTTKRIYLKKIFLLFDTSSHTISLTKIENLKLKPSITGRILGFGNIHVITGSGLGILEEGSGFGTGVGFDPDSIRNTESNSSPGIAGWFTSQRTRKSVDQNPEDCLFGIKKPSQIYKLINELIDLNS